MNACTAEIFELFLPQLLKPVPFPKPKTAEHNNGEENPPYRVCSIMQAGDRAIYIAYNRDAQQDMQPPDDHSFSRSLHLIFQFAALETGGLKQ